VLKTLSTIPIECFRKWEASMMLWEQAYREEATITNAEQWIKQESQHRIIVSLQVQEGRVVRLKQRQRGPKAGLKMPRRINLHLHVASG
jgi:hypothetical protein